MFNNCQNRKPKRSWEGKVKCWWMHNHKDLRFMLSPVVTECWKFVLFKPHYRSCIFKYTPVNVVLEHFLSFPWWSLKMMKNFDCRHILASCQTRRMLSFDWLFWRKPPDWAWGHLNWFKLCTFQKTQISHNQTCIVMLCSVKLQPKNSHNSKDISATQWCWESLHNGN